MAHMGARPPPAMPNQFHQPAKKQKLPKLPPNAKVTKRPLLRPAIASPYTNASQQKVVYVSARTPFLSVVKRVEKLLDLSDKRLVQAATTLAKAKGSRKRKRAGDEDEIRDVAEEVERLKGGKKRKVGSEGQGLAAGDGDVEDVEAAAGEEVVMKGTGKAINRVLEMAVWFQQREERFRVRLKTGSVGAVDDVEVREPDIEDREGHEDGEGMDVDGDDAESAKGGGHDSGKGLSASSETVPETRIRYVSVLEVYVSLR